VDLADLFTAMKIITKATWHALVGHPHNRLQERLDAAAKKLAECQGEIAEAQFLHHFYETRVQQLDPYVDHWEFAKQRQKQIDQVKDLTALERRYDERQAKFESLKENQRTTQESSNGDHE